MKFEDLEIECFCDLRWFLKMEFEIFFPFLSLFWKKKYRKDNWILLFVAWKMNFEFENLDIECLYYESHWFLKIRKWIDAGWIDREKFISEST